MKKANHDTYVGIIFLLFCGFAWWQISKLPLGVGFKNSIGPEFFPGVMTATIAILSVALIIRSLWRSAQESGEKPALAAGNILLRIALFIILLIVYILTYEPLGFLLSSGLVLPAGMVMLGEKRLTPILLFPAVIIGVGYLGFTKIMMVPLPEFPMHLF